jgi:hypothetical protein
MKSLLLLLLPFAGTTLCAQTVVDVNKNDRVDGSMVQIVAGHPFVNVKFVSVVGGTPYFKDQWMKGTVVSADDKIYKGGIYKLNLIDNELHFLNGEQEMIASLPIKDLTLEDTITHQSYHFVHSSNFPESAGVRRGWYLQLASGKATLYQFIRKVINESKPYGSATAEQRISTGEEFFIAINYTFNPVKKAKDAPSVFPKKNADLEQQFKVFDKQFRTPAEKLTALVNYYNSL